MGGYQGSKLHIECKLPLAQLGQPRFILRISQNMQLDLIMPLDKFLTIPSELIRNRQQPIYYRMTGSMGQLLHEERLFDLLRTGLSKPIICL